MTEQLTVAPVLSTTETHIFEDPTLPSLQPKSQRLTDEQLYDIYEIERTAREITAGGWQRIALQFPDGMLTDAPRVFGTLEALLAAHDAAPSSVGEVSSKLEELDMDQREPQGRRRLFILADTSYGSCCVDEIAAEHADADVVVHYGRSCFSPTARLPVIYVYTTRLLNLDPVVSAFEATYPAKQDKIILVADITYDNHVAKIEQRLKDLGYTNIYTPEIIHDPSSQLPNRTTPPKVNSGEEELKGYKLFHVSDPPPALLLTLSSRLQSIHIYPTDESKTIEANTAMTLRRRYALITRLSTNPIFGILINTLSVKNYLPTITKIQEQIAAAGKKSYTFVVGKVNAAKVANFSEIGGWVVVGCWESSLIESTEFYRPIITPFELSLCLKSDDERIWTGEWRGDFTETLETEIVKPEEGQSDDESTPPEFDFRTGRYISHSRPMRMNMSKKNKAEPEHALIKRVNGDLATINGAVSPGAEYLKSQRTWKGLGSDFEIEYEADGVERGSAIEEGRSGVARGYTVGEDAERT